MMYALALVAGMLTWSLIEYTFHRFLGHVWPKNGFGHHHLRHHREYEYFAPASEKAKIATFTLSSITAVGWVLGGPAPAFVYSAGIVVAYLSYEWFHRQLHVSAPRTAFGRWARRHHFAHHHTDPRHNHGVTTGVWDAVFGTLRPVDVVRIPRSKVPRWLVGDGSEDWREDYEVIGAS